MTQRVKQIHIAEHVGVSQATVSMVLSGSGESSISEEVRRKIFATATEMGYRPRTRRSARTQAQTICLVLGSVMNTAPSMFLQDAYFSRFYTGILEYVEAQGSHLLLTSCAPGEPMPETLTRPDVQGAIVIGADEAWIQSITLPRPFVLLRSYVTEPPSDVVLSNDPEGLLPAMRALYRLGHRRIALFSMVPSSGVYPPDSMQGMRIAGYHRGLDLLNLPFVPSYLEFPSCVAGGLEETDAFALEALKRFMALPEPPTAILTLGDGYANGILKAARQLGITIPDELSLAGYDDTVICSHTDPPLTSLNQNLEEMAHQACRLLYERIADPMLPVRRVLVDTRLVTRGTIGPVPTP